MTVATQEEQELPRASARRGGLLQALRTFWPPAQAQSDVPRWLRALDVSNTRRGTAIAVMTILVILISVVDYVTGNQISLAVVYVVPIALAAWFVGRWTAIVLSVLSVVLWIWGDTVTGRVWETLFIPAWNTFIRFVLYWVVIELLVGLRQNQAHLEDRVRERTAELTREIMERDRLKNELLEVSEREQRRIGQDMHDGLCQHLTGTALASQVLTEKLASHGFAEAEDARKVVNLVEEAISLSRSVARGLYTVEVQADGLMQALDEYAMTTSELFRVDCRFASDSPVFVPDAAAAVQLFRIAQEAVRNAIKHGRASKIGIYLDTHDDGAVLRILDNGGGFAPSSPRGQGMGLRIMAYRAQLIGALFHIGPGAEGGVAVTCILPIDGQTAEGIYGTG